MEPKQKQHLVVNGTGDGSRVQCYKKQYCIGTWNVRSMNQGKLEVVKQAMTRVNFDILGIISTTLGRNPLEEMEQPLQSARVQNVVLGCSLKNDRMISVCFQGKPFNITVIQAYAPTSNTEEAEVDWFYKDLQDLLELTQMYTLYEKREV